MACLIVIKNLKDWKSARLTKVFFSRTYPIDENARQDEVENVKHRPPPEDDVVGDVRKWCVRATRIENNVPDRRVILQVELPILLVV